MNDGLGMRYAAVGTLETTHLNADGFRQYCDKYANTINTVCSDMKELPKFTRTMISDIADQLEAEIPLDEIQRRRDWRDLFLIRLWQLKKEMESLK
ncbi:hypothetical protein WA026_023135 [Henosepilachna vigintioctopunctata]|uniref:Uncharacterized protein n=1 Tax=Henosepilachna vigintioctopunctata TaxID=420089 RepID=A0AAW1TYZ0_9CUCU